MVEPIEAELLTTYTLEEDGVLYFKNRDKLLLGRGKYYTCAFGVVIDLERMTCRATEKAQWKLNPPPRHRK